MKLLKILPVVGLLVLSFAAHSDVPPVIRTSIYSTSIDWEAVTDLRLSQHYVNFNYDRSLAGSGLELYFLDGFPCFAQTESARIWIGANDTDGKIRITCLFAPEKIMFAWRNADRDASQAKTTGLLECPVSGESDLQVDLYRCKKLKDWKEYR